jgi:hypothetical protein
VATDGTFGNRFDDPGAMVDGLRRGHAIPESERFRVVYCATSRTGAFAETIAQFRVPLDVLRAVAATPLPAGEADALRGVIPLKWCGRRYIGATVLDPSLRFVDIAAPETLTHLRDALAPLAVALGIDDIDLSTVTSRQRRFTQEVARYVYEQVDEGGVPRYAGIRYLSRLHAEWECWAIFHDRMLHDPCPHESIFPDDPGLLEAARVLGIEPPAPF